MTGYSTRKPVFNQRKRMKIPKIIQEKTKELGYESCSFVGNVEGAQAFQLNHGFKGKSRPQRVFPLSSC